MAAAGTGNDRCAEKCIILLWPPKCLILKCYTLYSTHCLGFVLGLSGLSGHRDVNGLHFLGACIAVANPLGLTNENPKKITHKLSILS